MVKRADFMKHGKLVRVIPSLFGEGKKTPIELTRGEIKVLLESLEYSIRNVSEAQGTPHGVQQGNLKSLHAVQKKLRQMRDEH